MDHRQAHPPNTWSNRKSQFRHAGQTNKYWIWHPCFSAQRKCFGRPGLCLIKSKTYWSQFHCWFLLGLDWPFGGNWWWTRRERYWTCSMFWTQYWKRIWIWIFSNFGKYRFTLNILFLKLLDDFIRNFLNTKGSLSPRSS